MNSCKYCGKEIDNRFKMTTHVTYCDLRPQELKDSHKEKLRLSSKGRITSNETKKKISESRKKYLLDHPDQVPYKLNHKHKETYPERYFKRILKGFVCQYRPDGTLYEIDFANVEKQIAIEIDGEQHYVDKRIVEHDIKRTKILEDLGWKIIRVRWAHYSHLNKYQKIEIIKDLFSYSPDVSKKLEDYVLTIKNTRRIEVEMKMTTRIAKIENRKNLIVTSGIDFTKFGWIEKLKSLLVMKKSPAEWMMIHMKDFYAGCYRR